jgi:hypothetical protein
MAMPKNMMSPPPLATLRQPDPASHRQVYAGGAREYLFVGLAAVNRTPAGGVLLLESE